MLEFRLSSFIHMTFNFFKKKQGYVTFNIYIKFFTPVTHSFCKVDKIWINQFIDTFNNNFVFVREQQFLYAHLIYYILLNNSFCTPCAKVVQRTWPYASGILD